MEGIILPSCIGIICHFKDPFYPTSHAKLLTFHPNVCFVMYVVFVSLLSQWLNFNLLWISYLVRTNKFKLLFHCKASCFPFFGDVDTGEHTLTYIHIQKPCKAFHPWKLSWILKISIEKEDHLLKLHFWVQHVYFPGYMVAFLWCLICVLLAVRRCGFTGKTTSSSTGKHLLLSLVTSWLVLLKFTHLYTNVAWGFTKTLVKQVGKYVCSNLWSEPKLNLHENPLLYTVSVYAGPKI